MPAMYRKQPAVISAPSRIALRIVYLPCWMFVCAYYTMKFREMKIKRKIISANLTKCE